MAVAKMKKLYLVAHQSEKDKVLSILQQSGVVEIGNVQAMDEVAGEDWTELVVRDHAQEELHEKEAALREVNFALDFLNRHYPAKKNFFDAFGGNRVPMSAGDFAAGQEKWAAVARDSCNALRKVDEKLMSLRNEETRLQNLTAQLSPWVALDVPLEEVRVSEFVYVELGTLPVADFEPCRRQLAGVAEEAILAQINTDRKDTYILLAYPAWKAEAVQDILKKFNFSRHQLSSLKGTPADNLARIREELAAIAKERQKVLEDAQVYTGTRETLRYYSDYLVMERDKKQAVGNFARTNNSFVVEGWALESGLPVLENRLAQQCETVEAVCRAPRESEPYPVQLTNNRFVAPFEFITRLYGTPAPRAIDPTFPMAPFFVVFFGLCLGDAGYGLVLTVLSALALWKLKMSVQARKIFWIAFAGGVSTMVFGVLISGWFGGLIPMQPLFFNALVDPMRMLIYSLIIGLVQLFFGMGIQFYRNVREGKLLDAIFDQLFWATLILGLIFLALPGLSEIGRIMSLASAAGLVLTQGRAQTGIVKKFLSGLFSLYNITGFLGDILSYSRLLALGLAGSVIAMAVNMLAGLFAGSVIGYIVMIGMMIGGHIFNLLISILGAFVHSSRLQYLEFFNRFYEGGGRPFKPFQLQMRHVDVISE
jgi:V/A-type H+-transporting ATPase subunit I